TFAPRALAACGLAGQHPPPTCRASEHSCYTAPMRFLKLIAIVLLLGSFARADFSFVHITDSHVSANEGQGANADNDAAAFREISNLIPKPAFIAHTGDVCESATPREYAIWQRVLKDL